MKSLSYKHTFFSCYIGAVVQAIVCGFLPLLFVIFNREYKISLPLVTLLATVNFMTQLATDSVAIFFVEKAGYRKTGILAYFLVATGLFCLGVVAPLLENIYIGIFVSVIMFSIGGGLLEVLLSPIVEGCPSENKSASMSLLHSMFGFGSAAAIVVTTLLLKIFGWQSWRAISALWALLPFVNGIYFAFVPVNNLVNSNEKTPLTTLFADKTFWGFLLVMVCGGASEIGMSQWASAFAESSLGISKAAGDVLGPCVFALMMAGARVLYSKFADRIDLSVCIIASGVFTFVCYIAAALVPVNIIALLACGLCGFATGILWPGTISLAAEKYPMGGATLFAILALAGDVGCSVGPSVVGFAASIFGGNLKAGLLFGASFPLILVVGLATLKKRGK